MRLAVKTAVLTLLLPRHRIHERNCTWREYTVSQLLQRPFLGGMAL